MRGGNAANPRQAWFDRNPLVVVKAYISDDAPAALTERWTYTVPASRKAYVEFGFLSVIKTTVAAAPANYRALIEYTPSGGAATQIIAAEQILVAVATQATETIGAQFIMLAGDTIKGYTGDGSTGGTVTFRLTAKITEYDA